MKQIDTILLCTDVLSTVMKVVRNNEDNNITDKQIEIFLSYIEVIRDNVEDLKDELYS